MGGIEWGRTSGEVSLVDSSSDWLRIPRGFKYIPNGLTSES